MVASKRSRQCLREKFVSRNAHVGVTISEFERVECIGAGSFGVVDRMLDKSTGQEIVVKTVQARSEGNEIDIKREVEILQGLDHPHVLRVFAWHLQVGTMKNRETIDIIMEDCRGGDLRSVVKRARGKSEPIREDWLAVAFSQAFEALVYLHGRGIVHKDLKSDNLLLLECVRSKERELDKLPHIVIADFGLAEVCSQHWFPFVSTRCCEIAGTKYTMAPEVWRGSAGPKCDVWSMGVVLFEVLAQRVPFMVEASDVFGWEYAQQCYLKCIEYGPNWRCLKQASAPAQKLCKKLLDKNEKSRPNASMCLQDVWFLKHTAPEPSSQEIDVVIGALSQWVKKDAFQRALYLKLAAESKRMNKFSQWFRMFDENHSGRLSQKEIRTTLKRLGLSKESAKQISLYLDFDRDGHCEYLEFAAACLGIFDEQLNEMLRCLFVKLDVDKDGVLSKSEVSPLRDELCKLVPPSTDLSKNELFNSEHGIHFSDFASYFGCSGNIAMHEAHVGIYPSQHDTLCMEAGSDFDDESDAFTDSDADFDTLCPTSSQETSCSFSQSISDSISVASVAESCSNIPRSHVVSLGESLSSYHIGHTQRYVSL